MMGTDEEECMKKMKNSESVVLDMESLSSLIYAGKSDHTSVKGMDRSMSRKASNWFERKPCEGRDSDKEFITSNEGRFGLRRYMSWDRRSSPWLGPRRVLLFFATLSSMGTILLIYFTLSTTNMNGVDGNTTFQS